MWRKIYFDCFWQSLCNDKKEFFIHTLYPPPQGGIYRFAFDFFGFFVSCVALRLRMTKFFIFLWIATILRIAKSRNDDSWYRLLRIAFVMQDLQVATQ